jgi:hypothetical protein
MQRDTQLITLPSGIPVTVYTYLTAGESNEIKAVMMKAMKIDISDLKSGTEEVPLKGQIDGSILMEQEKILVKSLLVKVGELPANPDLVSNLRDTDYLKLVEILNSIKAGNLQVPK